MIRTRRARLTRSYRPSLGFAPLALAGDRAQHVAAAFVAVAGKNPEKQLKSGSLREYAEPIKKMLPR